MSLRQLRLDKNLTQKEMASFLGCTQVTYQEDVTLMESAMSMNLAVVSWVRTPLGAVPRSQPPVFGL